MTPTDDPRTADTALVEQELQREAVKNERVRSAILTVVLGAIALAGAGVALVDPAFVHQVFGDRFRPGLVAVVALLTCAVEAALWFGLGILAARGRTPPALARYANAVIEISLPSLVILYVGSVGHPIHVLLGPPVFAYFILIVLSTLRLDVGICVATGLVAAIEYALLARIALADVEASGLQLEPILIVPQHHVGKALLLLATGVLAGFVTRQIRQRIGAAVATVQERNRVIELFGRHVSPAVVDKLLAQPNAEGEMRQVCIMFLDIRDFTTFSEGRRPEEVVQYLNGLFDPLIDCVNRNHGFINKFLGDGFMAVFGAPLADGEASRNAVRSAREILGEVTRLVSAGTLPPTRVGIGLHTGEALTGNVGSSHRKEYTIIGDVVNLASRIEGLNKQFGSMLLVSGEVRAQAADLAGEATPRGPVQVKGRAQTVEIFQLA